MIRTNTTFRIHPPRVALALAGLLALPTVAAADPALLYILDASGSMWGRAGGETKIASAKTVLKDLIARTPEHIQVGLLAYGHRKKGDCADIELLAPLGEGHDGLARRIDAIDPKGRTPISASLEQAGNLLAKREDATTLVLVSDGLETCGGDPCATARRLREQGHRLVIHVVGFDVDSAQAGELQCVAEAGGGRYFAAGNAEALHDALDRVRASVVEARPVEPPPPPPKVEVTAPAESRSKRIRIAGPGTVRLKPAPWVEMPPHYWRLMEVETGKAEGRASGDSQRIKPGEYQIVWRQSQHGHADVTLNEVVRVEAGATVEVSLDTGLRITLPEGLAAPYRWGLAEPGERRPLFTLSETLGPVLVPAGDYRVIWRQTQHGSVDVDVGAVQIEPGRLNDLVLDRAILPQPADWAVGAEGYQYRLVGADGQEAGRWGVPGLQLAPPGDYDLMLRPSQHNHREMLWGRVTVPEHGVAAVPLNSGIRFIHAADAPPPYRVVLTDLDNNRQFMMSETWDPLPVPPGRYRLDWWEVQHGSSLQTLVEELQVEAGVLLELEM